ncbi:MAG: protein phosphatase 2C domain-containing protein [Methylococcaceae bacterium]
MYIDQGCISHIGRRKDQQDAFGFSDFEDTLFIAHGGVMSIVCDGMGGLENGGDAAQLAVKSLLDSYMAKTPEQIITDTLDQAIVKANNAVVQLGLQTKNLGNVGTTLAVAVIYKDQLFWRTAGDSRIYLKRNTILKQLNVDHSYTQELLQNLGTNNLSEDDAINHPNGNALVSYLGVGEPLQIDKNELPVKLQPNDVLLICTDGLYNALTADDFEEALANTDAMKAAKALQHKTLDRQVLNQDNLTGIVLRLQKDQSKKLYRFLKKKVISIFSFSLVLILIGYILCMHFGYIVPNYINII